MDAAQQARSEEKQKLLARLAEITIEEQIDQGLFLQTPHYSVIERQAVMLGRELSRQTQERGAREIAANYDSLATCPTCQTVCQVRTNQRTVTSIDGPVNLTETQAYCRRCRRLFFPSAC